MIELPKWIRCLCVGTVKDCWNCKAAKALSIALEALDNIDSDALMVKNGSDPGAWADAVRERCKDTMRRIRELGER